MGFFSQGRQAGRTGRQGGAYLTYLTYGIIVQH